MNVTNILCYGLLFTPFLWLLGVDQFAWYVVPLLILANTIKTGRLYIGSRGDGRAWLLALLCLGFVSAWSLFSAPTDRWFSYLRDTLTLALLVGLVVTQRSPTDPRRDSHKLMLALGTLTGIVSALGLLAFAADLTQTFSTPFGYMLPSFIRHSRFASAMLEKSLIANEATEIFSTAITRVKSIFMFPNVFALALGVGLPTLLYCVSASRSRLPKVCYALGVLAALVVLIITTSRAGIASALAGFATFAYLRSTGSLSVWLRRGAIVVVAAALLGTVALYLGEITQAARDVIFARGRGSADARLLIYLESLRAILVNPFGYGTYRDVPGFGKTTPPLGSHSTYLGIVFKYGVAGGICYALFLLGVLRAWRNGYAAARRCCRTDTAWFYPCTAWALATNMLHQITAEVLLDLNALLCVVALWLAVLMRAQFYDRVRAFIQVDCVPARPSGHHA